MEINVFVLQIFIGLFASIASLSKHVKSDNKYNYFQNIDLSTNNRL